MTSAGMLACMVQGKHLHAASQMLENVGIIATSFERVRPTIASVHRLSFHAVIRTRSFHVICRAHRWVWVVTAMTNFLVTAE